MTEEPRFEIYTTDYCGFCQRAKALLNEHRIPYKEVDVTDDDAAREQLLERAHGRRTVPVIFRDGVPLGGYAELAALARAGLLPG